MQAQIQSPMITIKKIQRMKDLPKTWGLTGKQFENFRRKKCISSLNQATPRNKRPIGATNEGGHCNQEELNSTKLEKKIEFRSKLLELCKTRTKKSSPDLFNFYVILAGHDMVTNNDSSTTWRSKFKAPSLKTNTKNE